MNRFAKIAAGILIVAGIAGVLYYLTVGEVGTTVAFADVQEIIRNARTVRFTGEMTTNIPKPPDGDEMIEMKMHMDIFQKEPGLMRQEISMLMGGKEIQTITIADISSEEGQLITLIPAQKKAITFALGELPEEIRKQHTNYLEEIRKLIEGSNQPLGEREIDGQMAKGFHVTNMGYEMDIWVDAETALPVRMEFKMPGIGSVMMTDFAFDIELDDELFDLTIPEGYTVQEMDMPLGDITEDDLIEGLRFLAELNNETFPPSLTYTPEMMKNLMKRAKKEFEGKEPTEEEQMKYSQSFGMKIARVMIFIQAKGGENWRYAGDGVALGDSDTPVCWYRPEDSETYRVVYGDLRVEDVAEEDLPSIQPAAEPTEIPAPK